jgi:baseplate J-like protein
VILPPDVDGRRVESFVAELRRYAPHYTPELNLSARQDVGVALMRIFAQLAEAVSTRLDRAPQKNFVAFLDRLGIVLLPARPARAAVTFRLASGLTTPVRVPQRTRVTAPGPDDDIPFETTGDLVAIPGTIAGVFGVDPLADAIFRPPPGFPMAAPRDPTALVYDVQSFAAAGATRLQLNHATALLPGSYLRIDCRQKAIVSKVEDGNIVTLDRPLGAAAAVGARVTPIRDFEVFDGIDLQEHVLYLADRRLLTVKQAKRIRINVVTAGTAAPLNVAWEFWTQSDDQQSPDHEPHWHPLEVKADTTAGFTSSGSILLARPADLPITGRAVNGVDSQWIRGRLVDKLPPALGPRPRIDSIQIGVDSPPDEMFRADQGFYNATPLDVQVDENVGFFPFGTEPRQFDQFYIASKEAFSKRKAEVTLRIDLDLQTLAAPSVVRAVDGARAYSIGLRRSLFELSLNSGGFQTFGSPVDSPTPSRPEGSGFLPVEDSVPSPVIDGTTQRVLVFTKTEDSRAAVPRPNAVWVHFHVAGQASGLWIDLGSPDQVTQIAGGPAAIKQPAAWIASGFARVFVVANDRLYSRVVSNTGAPQSAWIDHEAPSNVKLVSTPFVTAANARLLVFANSETAVHRLVLRADGTKTWTSLDPGSVAFTRISRAFAQPYGLGDEAKVFVMGLGNAAGPAKLFECDTASLGGGQAQWDDLGKPPVAPNTPVTELADPDGFVDDASQPVASEGKHIFVRGDDNRLYERVDGGAEWLARLRAGDPDLRQSVAVDVDRAADPPTLTVIAASSRNSLVTWTFELRSAIVPAAPDHSAVLLGDKASTVNGTYAGKPFKVIGGPGSTNPTETIGAYDGAQRAARLANPIAVLPTQGSECAVDGASIGFARNGSGRAFLVHDPPPAADLLNGTATSIQINGVDVALDFYSRPTGVVSLNPGAINPGDAYVLEAEVITPATEFRSIEPSSSVPELSWEYWNGRGWLSLSVIDRTRNLLTSDRITFTVPGSIESTEVAGQDNFWIRARLVGGDYGRETFKVVGDKVVSEKSALRPPKIQKLLVRYVASPVTPETCVTFNNLEYLDQTASCQLEGAQFEPFVPLEDASLTVFFGFEQPFKSGPVRLLLDAAERDYRRDAPPAFAWKFRRDHDWQPLDAEDGSVALTQPGILTLSASSALTLESRFGQPLFWVKGTLRGDLGGGAADYPLPLVRGLYLNTVRAIQGETVTDEIVASSDGEPGQRHPLQHRNVLEGEGERGPQDIRVEETLSAEERDRIVRDHGAGSVTDREDIGGTWVRWTETRALFNCGPDDRAYTIDRAAGLLQFGDSVHGRIPPAGIDNIRAFAYSTGGGAAGNVGAGGINALATAVEGIESVFNPIAAGGGSDVSTTEAMLTIGPRQISHRDRAVSAQDFEELALESSRQVAKARCLTATNLMRAGGTRRDPCDAGQRHTPLGARGWVSLIVVPDSNDARPCPSLELRRAVADYVRARAPFLAAAGDRIVVQPPDYVVVTIDVDIFVDSIDRAGELETAARTRLTELLHPVHGNVDRLGWEFGRPIAKSDVFAALEDIVGVDRVENLVFRFGGRSSADRVDLGANELLASGDHIVRVHKK